MLMVVWKNVERRVGESGARRQRQKCIIVRTYSVGYVCLFDFVIPVCFVLFSHSL